MRPTTISEWISNHDVRLRRLEFRRSQTIGNWVLEERRTDGALVARHTGSGKTVVVSLP